MQFYTSVQILFVLSMFPYMESVDLASYFQTLSDTDIVGGIFVTQVKKSLLECASLCLNTLNCTATCYNHNNGVCKVVVNTPKQEVLLVKNRNNTETLLLEPCTRTPPLCQNEGKCKEINTGRGYICTCHVDWNGDHCEIPINLCPWDGFKFVRGSTFCFYSSTESVDYYTAVQRCEAKNSSLAIGSNGVIDTMFQIAKELKQWLTVGLVKQDNVWRWLDNSTDSIKWRLPGEPSGDGNCANMFPAGDGLNDVPCNFPRNFLCQRKYILS